MDIFIANSKNYYSMLLYTTGSKDYNVKTRAAARKHGLLLNQEGLFDKAGKKINKPTDTETEILKYIGMNYTPPFLR